MQLRFPLAREQNRASFELWKAKVPLKEIRSHIQMAEVTLRRILTLARNNPDDPCPDQKAGSGKRFKVSEEPDGVYAKEAARSY